MPVSVISHLGVACLEDSHPEGVWRNNKVDYQGCRCHHLHAILSLMHVCVCTRLDGLKDRTSARPCQAQRMFETQDRKSFQAPVVIDHAETSAIGVEKFPKFQNLQIDICISLQTNRSGVSH
jgi:hypothetical protein